MTKEKQQNQQRMKIANRQLVLTMIKQEEEFSRADLAKQLKMSPTSMTRICNDLKELGFIREGEAREGMVGRRAVMLKKNPDAFYSLGILLRTDFISFIILDYNGKIRYEKKFIFEVSDHPDETVHQILHCMEKVKGDTGDDWEKVKSVGMSVPGIIEPETGMVVRSNLFHWEKVPLGKMLKEKIQMSVYLENDVNASIVEEYESYSEFQVSNLGFLSLSLSLGASFLQEGRLFRGAHHGCGEISHKTLVYGGKKCKCGKSGCAAAYLSTEAILSRAEEIRKKKASLEDICSAYEEKQQWALALEKELSGYLAVCINDCLIYQNPQILIIGGRNIQELPFLCEKALEKKEFFHSYLLEHTKIVISKGNGMESVKGAAYLAARKYESQKLGSLGGDK